MSKPCQFLLPNATLVCVGANLHGALISTSVALTAGRKIEIYVNLTGKRSKAEVVYVDPEKPRHYGVALEVPQNIWGVSLPPKDWDEVDLE